MVREKDKWVVLDGIDGQIEIREHTITALKPNFEKKVGADKQGTLVFAGGNWFPVKETVQQVKSAMATGK